MGFSMSLSVSRLVVLAKSFVGWLDNRSFEVLIDSWIGSSTKFDRSISLIFQDSCGSGRLMDPGVDTWIDSMGSGIFL